MGKILVNPNKIRVTIKNIIEEKSLNINGNIFKAKGRIMIPKRTPAVINKKPNVLLLYFGFGEFIVPPLL
jgi:hypothetical protein